MARKMDSQSLAAGAKLKLDLGNMGTLTRPSRVKIGLVGAALGLRGFAYVGNDVLMEDSALSGANRMPIEPDDFIVDAGMPLEQINVTVNNPTAGAIVLNWAVEVQPLA